MSYFEVQTEPKIHRLVISNTAVACLVIIHVTLSAGNGRCDAGILLCNAGAVTRDTRSALARVKVRIIKCGEFYLQL